MHRTQILLEENEYTFLRQLAKRKGMSLSAVVRELIHKEKHLQKGDALFSLVGFAEDESDSVGVDHDKYLYGTKD